MTSISEYTPEPWETQQAKVMEDFFGNIYSYKTPTQIWLESDRVSKICREWEVERLESEGAIIGGLS